jgi:thioredoxin reductase (NADPH)
MYDIAIIGGGPAGLSAAVTARARNKDVVVVANAAQENPLAKSHLVDNYPGLPDVSGLELLEKMHAHAHKLGAKFLQARVISVLPIDGGGQPDATGNARPSFSITTSGDYLEAKTVIIACGAASGGKPLAGEQDYLGRGVSYCATCDGMLYRTATVLVAGLSPEAADEANFLAGLGATVHYVAKQVPHGLDPKIVSYAGKVLSIQGNQQSVTEAVIETSSDSQQLTIKCSGVFILRPSVAPTTLLPTLELSGGYIAVDDKMQTNVRGVFAAGDCTGKPLQVAKAVGQGQIAVLQAVEYLDS